MGVQIKDILEYNVISLESLRNKRVVIDSFNMIYQFLTTIRQPDGEVLRDHKGRTTSHLKGLFNRCIYFKQNNIEPIFVFDGKPPKLKEEERRNREIKKIEADEKYKKAVELGLMEDAAKYIKQTVKIDKEIIEEFKELIDAFGFPIVEAPSEGEAQCAKISQLDGVLGSVSQDFDSLLFGAKNLIRNLSISSRRKIANTNVYKNTEIEIFNLEKNLKKLNLDMESFIILGILVGTDFNPGGIKGIGPKKALKLVKEYKDRWDELFKILDWFSYFNHHWIEIYNFFRKPPVLDIKEFKFKDVDKERIKNFLIERDFDEEILNKRLDTLKKVRNLTDFLK